MRNPQSWNKYAYVTNNPATLRDPSGMFSLGGLFHGLAGLVGDGLTLWSWGGGQQIYFDNTAGLSPWAPPDPTQIPRTYWGGAHPWAAGGIAVSNAGVEWIKKNEGYSSTPYDDGAGNATVGYGHKILPNESYNGSLSPIQADALLRSDLADAARVMDRITVSLNDFQITAIIDWIFNLGSEAFANSRFLQALNNGDYDRATREMVGAVYANGQVVPGLINRRQKESDIFWGGS